MQDPATYVVVEAERGVLAVSGSDRVTWLNGVVTCDAALASPGRAVFGLLLSKQGKIQTDFLLLASTERLFLTVVAGTAELVRAELERMLVMEDAEVEDASAELALVMLVGPQATELARGVASPAGRPEGEVERPGLGGAALLVARQELESTVASLQAAGAVRPDPVEWQRIRVARRVAVFGADYGPGDNPHEAGLDRTAVSWSKGCYLGQEVVARIHYRGGVNRHLRGLEIDAAEPPLAGAELHLDGRPLGTLSSVARSPRFDRVLGLAILHRRAEPGTEVEVGTGEASVQAKVVELPWGA